MLDHLSPEQIVALGTAVAAIIGAIGVLAHRAANRPVAPASVDGPPGTIVLVNAKQVGDIARALELLVQEAGVVSTGLIAHRKALEEHRESVDDHRHVVENNARTAQAVAERAERLAREMESLRDQTRELRDEMLRRAERDEMQRRDHR